MRLLLSCLLSVAGRLCAQSQYSIDWFTLDGGGGMSTGGVFCVSGTIGQADAGVMGGTNASGCSFTLVGGFWGVIATVQTQYAPLLSVARTGTNTIVVWWPPVDEGWTLQASSNLAAKSIAWTRLSPPYATNAASLYFVEPAPAGHKFYRLHKP